MSKVLLTSVVEGQLPAGHDNLRPLEVLRACAQIDRFGVHEIVTDPARADLILFVEQRGPGLYQAPFWRHPLVRRHPERCFAYCAIDSVVPFLPGIYPSQPRRGPSPARYRGGHYLNGLFRPNPGALPMPAAPPLLYSFRGRFATLLNIAADRAIVPEFLQDDCAPEKLSAALERLLKDSDLRDEQVRAQFAALDVMGRGKPSAADIAADAILADAPGA